MQRVGLRFATHSHPAHDQQTAEQDTLQSHLSLLETGVNELASDAERSHVQGSDYLWLGWHKEPRPHSFSRELVTLRSRDNIATPLVTNGYHSYVFYAGTYMYVKE